MNFLWSVIGACCAMGIVVCQSYLYEKMHKHGPGRKIIPNFRRLNPAVYEYPAALPTTKVSPIALIQQPYRKLYQGMRRPHMDTRVYRRTFDYPPSPEGHRILCESLVDCTITFIAVETDEGIPIILRGGAGYRHFSVIVRAKPGKALNGTIRVYCNKQTKGG